MAVTPQVMWFCSDLSPSGDSPLHTPHRSQNTRTHALKTDTRGVSMYLT